MQKSPDAELQEQLRAILDTPIKFLVRWGIDKDAARELLRLADGYLAGTVAVEDIRFMPDFVSGCRKEYRSGTRELSVTTEPTATTEPLECGEPSVSALAELLAASARRFCTPQQVERFERSQATGVVSSAELARHFGVSRVAVHDSVMIGHAFRLVLLACGWTCRPTCQRRWAVSRFLVRHGGEWSEPFHGMSSPIT